MIWGALECNCGEPAGPQLQFLLPAKLIRHMMSTSSGIFQSLIPKSTSRQELAAQLRTITATYSNYPNISQLSNCPLTQWLQIKMLELMAGSLGFKVTDIRCICVDTAFSPYQHQRSVPRMPWGMSNGKQSLALSCKPKGHKIIIKSHITWYHLATFHLSE